MYPFNVDDEWTSEDSLRALCQAPCDPDDPTDRDAHDDDCPAHNAADQT